MHLFNSNKKKQLDRLKSLFGKKPENVKNNIEDISVYYEVTKAQLHANMIDDITWNDLDMNRIFERINNTSCYIGEQTLYRHLHLLPEHSSEREELEKAVHYLTEKEDDRAELQYAMSGIGKTHEDYYLPMFLFNAEGLSISNVWIYRILQLLLFGSFMAGAVFSSTIC